MVSCNEIKADRDALRSFCVAVLQKLGVAADEAGIWAGVVVETSLRGVDSHGILVLPMYASMLEAGGIRLNTRSRTIASNGPTVLIDGNGGIGQVIADHAMDLAIERARDFGISLVAVRNSNHFGMAAYYALKSLSQEMIGAAFTNSGPALAAWGGKTGVIGSNAMAVAVPAGEEAPVVFDAAIGVSAAAKIFLAAEKGERIPTDWMIDKNGHSTDDPMDLFEGGVMLPFGKYKGYGLGVIVDVLTGVLSGGLFSTSVGRFGADMSEPLGVCHSFAALDIQKFISVDGFKRRMDKMIRNIKESEPLDGVERVYLPGERAFLTYEDRRRNGIPIHKKLVADLMSLAERLSIEPPFSI